MSTISCAQELCALDRHDITNEAVRHHRVTSTENPTYRVVATWADEGTESAYVELTYEGTTVILTAHTATFWARLLTHGGSFTPITGVGTREIAVSLGAAAEVLFFLDPDGVPPDFGSYYLTMSIQRTVSGYFADEDEGARA